MRGQVGGGLRQFLTNIYSNPTAVENTKREIGGLWDTITHPIDTLQHITDQGPGGIIQGVADAASRWRNPAQRVYEDPLGAAMDVSAVAGGVGAAARGAGAMTGVGALTDLGDAADSVSAATNPVSLPARAVTGGVSRAVQGARGVASRVGAADRNAAFLRDTTNPTGVSPAAAGADVKAGILAKKRATMRGLQDQYGNILGTDEQPSALGRANVPGAPQPIATSVDTGAVDAGGNPIMQSRTTMGPGEPGPSFRDLHDQRSDLLQQARSARDRQTQRDLMQQVGAVSDQMNAVAAHNGLSAEAADYFSTADQYKLATRQFENKFVARLLNAPDESVADLVMGRQPGVKPTGARDEGALSNRALMQRLQQMVPPETWQRLQGAVGQRLISDTTNAASSTSGPMLFGRLRKLDQAGVLDPLVPNAATLRQVAQVLTDSRNANAMTLPIRVAGGSSTTLTGLALSAVKKLATTALGPLEVPDLQYEIEQLNRSGVPAARRIASVLAGTITPTAIVQQSQRPSARALPPPPRAPLAPDDVFSPYADPGQPPMGEFEREIRQSIEGLHAMTTRPR
jgi:hypothetical protein